MKTITIEVPLRGNITNYEVQRAICNSLESYEYKYVVPELKEKKVNVKIREGAGLWNMLTGCLP